MDQDMMRAKREFERAIARSGGFEALRDLCPRCFSKLKTLNNSLFVNCDSRSCDDCGLFTFTQKQEAPNLSNAPFLSARIMLSDQSKYHPCSKEGCVLLFNHKDDCLREDECFSEWRNIIIALGKLRDNESEEFGDRCKQNIKYNGRQYRCIRHTVVAHQHIYHEDFEL